MTEVASYQYDNGGVGDGNITQETDYPNDGSANRVTNYYYDWRDRLVATKSGGGEKVSGTFFQKRFLTPFLLHPVLHGLSAELAHIINLEKVRAILDN